MNSQNNWYKTFFHGVALELWQKAITPEDTDAEITFIKELVHIPEGGSVLDTPCGFGRHSLALAKEGFRVTGIDIAEEYIQSLKDTAEKMNLPVTAIHADILEYEPQGEYDLAICLGNSFGYFSYEPLLAFVKKIGRVVKKNGAFLVHTGLLAESILPLVKEKHWMQIEDILFLSEHRYQADSGILQTNYGFIKKGQAEHRTAYYYVFTLAQVRQMLTEAGFGQIEQYNGPEKKPYRLGDREAYILARK